MNLNDELNAFEASLSSLAYKTKLRYIKHLKLFLEWLEKEGLKAGHVRTVDVLAFIDTQKKYSPEHKNRIVHTIKKWYSFKKYKRNPALGVKIRYQTLKPLHGLLDRKALDTLYHSYEATTLLGYRNKVIIGLLVFQGLTSGEIKRLQVNDIKLEKGEIYIRSTKQTNSRTLALEACQILEIKTYLDEIRPQFGLPAVRHGKATSQLIVNRKGTSVQGVINHLFKALRSRYSWAKHAGQVRQSVITEWLKEKDVRIVQYLAGHKKVKSTERYQSLDLEDLQEQLNKFHPLG